MSPIWNISTCPLAACAARVIALLLDLPKPVGGTPSTAICSGLPVPRAARRILSRCHDDLPAKRSPSASRAHPASAMC
jgi:hypothetical protein